MKPNILSLASVNIFLLLSTVIARAEPLTLETALDIVNPQLVAVAFAEEELIPFIRDETSRCQQRMSQQLLFTPPQLTCSVAHFLTPEQRQQLLILRRMLDISLADHRTGVESEALATAFIDFDRAQTRLEQGQRSELDVSYFQAEYQPVRVRFLASEKAQRQTRAMLAMVLATPETLSSDILLPDFSQWLDTVIEDEKPVITAALKANQILHRVERENDETLLTLMQHQLHFSVLEMLLALDVMSVEKEAAEAQLAYRNRYLDRSRTLYELEVKADLGDSMVEQSRARQKVMEVDYQRVMLVATLNVLRGFPLTHALEKK